MAYGKLPIIGSVTNVNMCELFFFDRGHPFVLILTIAYI